LAIDIIEIYDPASDTWEKKAAMPTPRYFMAANVVNGKIYLTGGPASDLNEEYDPETDTWMEKSPSTYPIHRGFTSMTFDDRIISLDTNVQTYNPETDSWTVGTPSPTDGYGATSGITSGVKAPKRIYIFEETATHVYNPTDESWTVGVTMLTARFCAETAVVNDTFYVLGGRAGRHDLLINVHPRAENEQYVPFDYWRVPPAVYVVSPLNQTYNETDVSLVFEVNNPVVWMGYSLDGQDNITVIGNVTLSGLSSGSHNITVYAEDEFENTGSSETVYFTAEAPFPMIVVAAASVAVIAVVAAGLLVHFKKRIR
jgi:hypothetical protein